MSVKATGKQKTATLRGYVSHKNGVRTRMSLKGVIERKKKQLIEQIDELRPEAREATIAEQLVAAVAKDGQDVNALCETYQLRREELGRLTGFSLRALAEWASGKLPSQPAKRRLHEVRRLLDALSEIVEPTEIPRWLRQSNKTFDSLTPLQVIELGEIDRLWTMVYDLGSGQPG